MSSWQLNLNDVEEFEHLGSINVTDQPSGTIFFIAVALSVYTTNELRTAL